jgi:hypothetical protein
LAILSAVHIDGVSDVVTCGSGEVTTALPTLTSGAVAPYIMLSVVRSTAVVGKEQAVAEFVFGDATVTIGAGYGATITTDDSPIVLATAGATHIAHKRAGNPGETCLMGVMPVASMGGA